ncbi:RHS repeat-associated core domain-containing protein [Pseudodesulfovibrio sp.]|uniref:RHS repeat domain-containing protein n=1 Tax=Pseudodesulfovibrio sp. TaxID=2035812 RepID=UPI0026028F9F|nr:RHS repeat-associated core domain-containing protein [Pseudodesulfovibrio sp.]MDD3311542.1 RHS repeat-associated core domain-containing protein [Pseudodesulfovibrio sp.]
MTPFTIQLRRDPKGRIVEKTETVAGRPATWAYAYDKAGRLTEAKLDGRTVCRVGYDRYGRRSNDIFPHLEGGYRNFAYTMNDRLIRAGNNQYTHDGNGFRSVWNHGGKYTRYGYAPDCRLLSAEGPDGAAFTFEHDDQGRRAAKYRNGRLAESYAWLDMVRLAGFFNGESGFEFAYRDGERTPFAMRRDDGAVFGLFQDQVGSLRVVVDIDNNVIKEVQYDPFGGILKDTNPALRIPIGFAGGLHDPDLGFVRFGWRDYDPFTSRWTAPDPMGDAGGAPDWYGYCLDDPVNGADPLGLRGKKEALARIAKDAAIGAGMGALRGSKAGWPGAAAGGFIGGSVGALRGTIKEYPPLRSWLDATEEKTVYELTDGKAERMKKTRLDDYDPKYYIQTQ